MRRYQQSCAEVIARFEGHIGHYIGDGILAYFGYPKAHEDDALRAIRAGLDIVEAIKRLTASSRASASASTSGSASTPASSWSATSAPASSATRWRWSARPRTSPPACRALAEPGTVVVGERTRRLVEGLFTFEERGPQIVKGIEEPIAVYRVHEATGATSRFEATARRGLTPLVGRDEEIRLLLLALGGRQGRRGPRRPADRRARDRQVAHRAVVPRRTCAATTPTVLRYYCSPFYVHSALHPVLDQLERAAGLKKTDSPEVKLDKLEALLSQGCREVDPRGGAAGAAAVDPDRPALPAARGRARAQEGADARGPARAARRARAAAAADPARGRALDRPDLDRAVPADHRAHPAPAGAGDHRLSGRASRRPGPAFRTSPRCRSRTSTSARRPRWSTR